MSGEQLKNFLFSLTIAFPAIIGLVRYRNSDPAYRPILWYIFLSLLNELFSGLYLVNAPKNVQLIDWQVFNLLECVLLLLQFYYWQRFRRMKYAFYIILPALVALWCVENFIVSDIYSLHYVFLIAYSFILVSLSINAINHIGITYHRPLYSSAMFIICVSFVIFFVYTIIVFVFLNINFSDTSIRSVFSIKVYVNALANLLYAVGIYFIPAKTKKNIFFDTKM